MYELGGIVGHRHPEAIKLALGFDDRTRGVVEHALGPSWRYAALAATIGKWRYPGVITQLTYHPPTRPQQHRLPLSANASAIRPHVVEYLAVVSTKGEEPNMDDACAYVIARFSKAGRDAVRAVYREETGNTRQRGRPRKNSRIIREF